MRDVPFFSNTADDSRCVQACFRMVLKYFLPQRSFTWKQLDALTCAELGQGTWWFPGLLAMKKLGIDPIMISPLDYRALKQQGISYLSQIMSSDTAQWYKTNSNLTSVMDKIPELLESGIWHHRGATWDDVNTLLGNGYLVGIEINAKTLNGQKGLSPHMVIIFQRLGTGYRLHDPGLPPVPGRVVSRALLSQAWKFDKKDTSLVAFKKSE